jgi:uncharacterized protein
MKKDRRNFLQRSLSIGAAALWPLHAKPANRPTRLPSLRGKKILFTYGGWDGHEPEKFAQYFSSWMKQESAEVVLSSSLDFYADKSLMNTIDLVVQQFTMSSITKEQEAGLLEAIKINGTGIAGWHGGLCDSFRNNTEYQYMTGGQWVAHPGGTVDYEVRITNQQDAITAGIKNFTIKTEQYYMHVDPNVKVLATTQFTGSHDPWIDGCTMPVTWKKMYGKGRVFYTSLAHSLSHVTNSPETLTMMKRGIQWASASKYEPPENWVSPVYR